MSALVRSLARWSLLALLGLWASGALLVLLIADWDARSCPFRLWGAWWLPFSALNPDQKLEFLLWSFRICKVSA